MSNDSTIPALPLVVDKDLAKAKINLALTTAQLNIQAVQDKVDSLVYNEDNIQEISDIIRAIKNIERGVETAFKEGKAPYLEGGKAWDAAKNDLTGLLATIRSKPDKEYTKLCQAVEKRKREADAETARKKGIEDLLNTTILDFSQEITACKTSAELVSIQARINAEQGKKSAYQEYLPSLVERCAELNPLLKEQKEAIKQWEGLEKDTQTAIETGNDELLLEIESKKEEIGGKIHETRIRVEEQAINSSIRGHGGGGFTQTFPEIKTKRRTWKHEVKDIAALYKKFPDLVTLTPNDEKIKEILKNKIADGETKDREEINYLGVIRFFVDKKY